jgi:diadenylate cyclase
MALGLLLLIVLYVVSQAMGLATTYMLLDQFMSVVVIFTLIIFQDDIRRALVRVGKFAWFAKAQETAVVEEVIRAASMLAAKRIGALIVFERDASLNEFIIQAGTRLEASVTKELLYAIFIPALENPLHDGAAIIKNYQIRQAGVFVPLSANPRIDKTLGTRHRAALGITEQTDAVSVVVSEERGAVSVCFEGHMSKDLDPAQLRKTLLSLFSQEKARARRDAAKERETKAPKEPPVPIGRDETGDGGAAAPPPAEG